MRKLWLLSSIVLTFNYHLCYGADDRQDVEEVQQPRRLFGYKPAGLEIQKMMEDSPRYNKIRMKAFNKAPDRTKIVELENIAKWPSSYVYDQGDIGSCTANSAAFCTSYLSAVNSNNPSAFKKNPEVLRPSRLYIYYNTRYHESKLAGITFNSKFDSGASIAGTLLALDIYGCCPEMAKIKEAPINTPDLSGKIVYKGRPYLTNKFNEQPEPLDYIAALDSSIDGLNAGTPYTSVNKPKNYYSMVSKALQYRDLASTFRKQNSRVENAQAEKDSFINSVIDALSNNRPVISGVLLDHSFMNDKKGYIQTPNTNEFSPNGGHAISIVGFGPYNKNEPGKCYFKFLNSWSPKWGDSGFGYLEENYFANVNIFQTEAFEVWLDKALSEDEEA